MDIIYRPYQIKGIEAIEHAIVLGQKAGRKVNPLGVFPCGSGKSIIIAGLCERFADRRMLVITHRIRLLKQNAAKIGVQGGIMSASVSQEDTFETHRVLTGTYQTLARRDFGEPDLIILDEAHLLSGDDETLLAVLLDRYPDVPVIGLTATPFRRSQPIYEGAAARWKKVYEVELITLIRQGYLVPPTTVKAESRLEDDDASLWEVTRSLLPEIQATLAKFGATRPMIFAQDISHAIKIQHWLETHHLGSRVVHSRQPQEHNEEAYAWFEAETSEMRYVVSCNMLLIGVDLPVADAVILLRRVSTIGTYVQIIGRGLRPSPLKDRCLVLDFGGAVKRFGFLDELNLEPRTSQAPGQGMLKTCEFCGSPSRLAVRVCPVCGERFEFRSTIDNVSTDLPILSSRSQVGRVESVSVSRESDYWRLDYRIRLTVDQTLCDVQEFVKARETALKREAERAGARVLIENRGVAEIAAVF